MRLLASLVIFCFLWTSCENDLSMMKETFSDNDVEKEILSNVELLYSDSAKLKVRILADVMYRVPDRRNPYDEFPEGVYVEFYDKEKISSWLESGYAIRYDRDDKIITRKNVILYNVKQDTFRSEELIWDEEQGDVFSERIFRFSNPKEVIYGYKFYSNQEFTNYRFSKMSGRLQVDALEKQFKKDN